MAKREGIPRIQLIVAIRRCSCRRCCCCCCCVFVRFCALIATRHRFSLSFSLHLYANIDFGDFFLSSIFTLTTQQVKKPKRENERKNESKTLFACNLETSTSACLLCYFLFSSYLMLLLLLYIELLQHTSLQKSHSMIKNLR